MWHTLTIQLRHETADDIAAIEAVTTAAFADAPHTSHTEQFIVRALRAANELTLSIVAEEHGRVVGHVALSPVTITHEHRRKTEGWYGLGPISVLPPRQGRGIGSRLMEQALSELRAMQAAGCVLLGDPTYYTRFGFQAHAGNCRACRPAISWRWPCMGQCRKASRTTAMPSTPPPEPARRRRRFNRLLALNTGRGHCRTRISRPPRPGRNGLGAVLIAVIPSSRCATTQSEAPRSRPGRLPSARVKRPVPRRVHPPLPRYPPGRPAPAFFLRGLLRAFGLEDGGHPAGAIGQPLGLAGNVGLLELRQPGDEFRCKRAHGIQNHGLETCLK